MLEADWWTVPTHSRERNISLSSHSSCTVGDPFLIFFERSLLLSALPGCSLFPVECLFEKGGGGVFRLPLEMGFLWGGVMWDWWAGVMRGRAAVVLAVRKLKSCWEVRPVQWWGSASGLAPIVNSEWQKCRRSCFMLWLWVWKTFGVNEFLCFYWFWSV